jgi:hypothetical protein
MSIVHEHSVDVKVSPERAFALLDDLPRTPAWLGPCTALEKVTPGTNKIGDRLRYAYKQGGRAGVMDGEIVERRVNESLVCLYRDSQMEVIVDQRIASSPVGSRLTHRISITPQTMMGKLMTPLIRSALPKQTHEAMEKLKSLLEKP